MGLVGCLLLLAMEILKQNTVKQDSLITKIVRHPIFLGRMMGVSKSEK
jgi:hypothetical protein